MAQILSINSSKHSDVLDMFKAITSPSMDIEDCPRGNVSTLYVFPACVGCPLLEVCSDECGRNDANGYY